MSKTRLTLLAVFVFVVIGCENKEIFMDNGLIIEDLIIGVGTTAEKYGIVTVHSVSYTHLTLPTKRIV